MKSSNRRDFLRLSVLGLTAGNVLADGEHDTDGAIVEPSRQIAVIAEADVCVLGGSCTGVFAAIRAARLGAKVVLVEKQNCFGGTATNSMVNVWHSLMDTEFKRQIIAGLTVEVLERLKKRGAMRANSGSHSVGFSFNSDEMKIELDEMVMVNMNQLGEAAGTAAYLALSTGTAIPELTAASVRKLLSEKGSIVI
jgi:ribulose 1,5-bisphosphate synthetase/thiazole synthase